jgi:uncharacterized alpha-E superfamily protein
VPPGGIENDYQLVELLTFARTNPHSIVSGIAAARENARQVREQISTEMWEQLNQLFLFITNTKMEQIWSAQPHDFFHAVKMGSHLFQGITDSTMNHGQGWQFIQLGRFIERAMAVSRLLDVEFQQLGKVSLQDTGLHHLPMLGLLKSCTAFEAYSKVYTAHLQPRYVAEFLLLNREFPHSICFAIDMIQAALNALAEATDNHKGARVYRLAGRLRATFDYGQIDEIMQDGLSAYLTNVRDQCIQIHDAIYQQFIMYPIEEKLAA